MVNVGSIFLDFQVLNKNKQGERIPLDLFSKVLQLLPLLSFFSSKNILLTVLSISLQMCTSAVKESVTIVSSFISFLNRYSGFNTRYWYLY